MPLAPNQRYVVRCVRLNLRSDKGTNRPLFAPIYEAPLLEAAHASAIAAGIASLEAQNLSQMGPGGRPWPKDFTQRVVVMNDEIKRLKNKFHDKERGDAIWDSVYAQGRFAEAFERAVTGAWKPVADMPEPGASEAAKGEPLALDPDLDGKKPKKPRKAKPAPKAEAPVDIPADEPVSLADLVAGEDEAPVAPTPSGHEAQIAELSKVKGVSNEIAGAIIDTLGVESLSDLAQVSPNELETVAGIGAKSAQNIAESAQELVVADL